jgi:nitrogenase molybdenum-iron protein NifN
MIRDDTDFEDMLEICRNIGVDIIIGNSKGYYLSKNLNIPLVRAGFPIHDRIGGQRIPSCGIRRNATALRPDRQCLDRA